MCNQANDSTSFDYFVKVLNVLASKILWSLCVVFWPTFWPTFGWIIEQNMYAKENLFEKCVFKGTVHIEILKNILWLFSHFHAVRNLFDFFWNKWRCFKECSAALFWIVTSSSKSDRKKVPWYSKLTEGLRSVLFGIWDARQYNLTFLNKTIYLNFRKNIEENKWYLCFLLAIMVYVAHVQVVYMRIWSSYSTRKYIPIFFRPKLSEMIQMLIFMSKSKMKFW